jgi:ribosome-binding factor A
LERWHFGRRWRNLFMSVRQERVRELLKRQIGEALRREYSVEEVGVITVNEVGVSNDLHSATVFVGIVGSESQRKKAVDILQKDRKRLQGIVGRSVVLKYTPQLKFVADDSITKGNRILAILDEIEKEHPTDEAPPKNH